MDQLPAEIILNIASYFKWQKISQLYRDNVCWLELYNRELRERKGSLEIVVNCIREQDLELLEQIVNGGWSFLSPTEIVVLAISTRRPRIIRYFMNHHEIRWSMIRISSKIKSFLALPTDFVLDLFINQELARSRKIIHEFIREINNQEQHALKLYQRIKDGNLLGHRWMICFDEIWDSKSWKNSTNPGYYDKRFHSFYRIQHYYYKMQDPTFVDMHVTETPYWIRDIYDWSLRVNGKYIGDPKCLLASAIENSKSIEDLCELFFLQQWPEDDYVQVVNKYRYDKYRDIELALDSKLHRCLLKFASYRDHPNILLYRYCYKMFDRSPDVLDIWQFIEITISELGYLPFCGYHELAEILHQTGRKEDARRLSYYQIDVRQP